MDNVDIVYCMVVRVHVFRFCKLFFFYFAADSISTCKLISVLIFNSHNGENQNRIQKDRERFLLVN